MTGSANTTPTRPHQALETARAGHAGRALPAGAGRAARAAGALAARAAWPRVPEPAAHADRRARRRRRRRRRAVEGGPVEFDRVVPPSGNLWAMRRQFWLGPQRAGQTVRFWAGVDVIHLTIAGARVKSLRSHLSTADLAQLAARGRGRGRPAAAAAGRATARRSRSTARSTTAASSALAGRQVLAAEILGGRPVIVRIEPQTLMFLDPDTRELLRVRPNPLTRRAGAAAAGRAPRRPAAAAPHRAGHRSAPRQRHRRDHRLPPTRRARPHPRRPHRHASTSPSTRSRSSSTTKPAPIRRTTTRPVVVVKGSRPHRARGNVNGTLGQRRAGNGASHNRSRTDEPTDPYET